MPRPFTSTSHVAASIFAHAVAWVIVSAIGCIFLARNEIAQQREAFETDARIAHRLLSQQVVQHDAILRTLALLQPATNDETSRASASSSEQRLISLYPQIIAVLRRDAGDSWPDAALVRAEGNSRQTKAPALADLDFSNERYRIVLAAEPASFALVIQARNMVPWSEWPMDRNTSPVRVLLEQAGQELVLQPGSSTNNQAGDSYFEFHKHLAAPSQAFDVVALSNISWAQLPWITMIAWSAAVAVVLALQRNLQGQRAARKRAEELLRLGQVARLNTLGELAAGMAHELNQPLTAMLANTQAAQRLLKDDPPDMEVARDAMAQAVEQARRASDVVSRLRRAVERPDLAPQLRAIDLQGAVSDVIDLLGPEFTRRHVAVSLDSKDAITVLADPVALEQITHNLIMNSLQAMDQVPENARQLKIHIAQENGMGMLIVSDSGPGISPEALPRLFEPFFSTRTDGLGLGLSLCETLAAGMNGRLFASPKNSAGAEFILQLPLKES